MAENRTVALAAVVVTGVVGVTGPLITWKATRDSGELSSRAQLVQADRADLRRVLDEAALVLRARRVAVDGLVAEWTRTGRALPMQRVARFDAPLQQMGAISEQLSVRLGPRSPLNLAYARALADLRVISDKLALTPEAAGPVVARREKLLTENSAAFFRRANEVAGSILK
jgi:hypothetical protein